MNQATSIYEYTIPALNSQDIINLSDYRGKYQLLVNVASRCGYTPQYKQLQQLYESMKNRLVVIGFPCNQFLWQENGSERKIENFCRQEYGVSFPISTKVHVKGNEQHPIYQWLTKRKLNGKGDYKVTWNFHKFLIDPEGNLVAHFGSKVLPDSDEILTHITS